MSGPTDQQVPTPSTSAADVGTARQLESDDPPVIPYEHFIAERHKVIDARTRSQQRVDQIVTGGAVGALVLSITFLEKIAPAPEPSSQWVLIVAWVLLLMSLGLNLISHFASCAAFDRYLIDFDRAYREKTECSPDNPATRLTRLTEIGSAVAFVIGVGFLATFALANVQFETAAQARAKAMTPTTVGAATTPPTRGPNAPGTHLREESQPSEPAGTTAATAATVAP